MKTFYRVSQRMDQLNLLATFSSNFKTRGNSFRREVKTVTTPKTWPCHQQCSYLASPTFLCGSRVVLSFQDQLLTATF
jgi:hypothetical protein